MISCRVTSKATRASPPPQNAQPAFSSLSIAELVVGDVAPVEVAGSPNRRPAAELDSPSTSCSTPIRNPPPLSSSPPYAHDPEDPDGLLPFLRFYRFPDEGVGDLGEISLRADVTDYRMTHKTDLWSAALAKEGLSRANITTLYKRC